MSMETDEQFMEMYQLYFLLQEGIEDAETGRVHDAEEAFCEIMERRRK